MGRASRTGTTTYLKIRAKVIRAAKEDGIELCPFCRVVLNYDEPRLPESAEVDHIQPVSQGGEDTMDNLQVICRRCNLRKSDKVDRPGQKVDTRDPLDPELQAEMFPLDPDWLDAVMPVNEDIEVSDGRRAIVTNGW
jgi:5-methylcytosine-specific restriction endonuclease McrA